MKNYIRYSCIECTMRSNDVTDVIKDCYFEKSRKCGDIYRLRFLSENDFWNADLFFHIFD